VRKEIVAYSKTEVFAMANVCINKNLFNFLLDLFIKSNQLLNIMY